MMSQAAAPFPLKRLEYSMPKPKVLWIDGVGSFAMCDADHVSIGQSFPGNDVDVAIRGDLSRKALIIRRHGEDHWIQPLQLIQCNGLPIERATVLTDGMVLAIGERIQLKYVRPTKLSGTARLDLMPQHRWQPLLTAPLLLGESCILGPETNAHIVCPDWTQRIVLFRHEGQWMGRTSGTTPVWAGGKEVSALFPLVPGQRIYNDDFSMTLD